MGDDERERFGGLGGAAACGMGCVGWGPGGERGDNFVLTPGNCCRFVGNRGHDGDKRSKKNRRGGGFERRRHLGGVG